jgi:uncharacterized protein YbjQ (UPF0145 family)
MNKYIFAPALLILLAGCASQTITKVPEGMKVVNQKDVADCEFKGDIHGVSMLYGVFAESALSKARQQAFEQAKALNANAVVWQPFTTEAGATSVHGNAYSCN